MRFSFSKPPNSNSICESGIRNKILKQAGYKIFMSSFLRVNVKNILNKNNNKYHVQDWCVMKIVPLFETRWFYNFLVGTNNQFFVTYLENKEAISGIN